MPPLDLAETIRAAWAARGESGTSVARIGAEYSYVLIETVGQPGFRYVPMQIGSDVVFHHTPNQHGAEAATGVRAALVDYDGGETDDGGTVDVAESAGRVVVLLETGGIIDDDVDDEPFTAEEFALFVALGELDAAALSEVFDATQARYPQGHPKGGQWRPMADRIKQSIEDHKAGKHGDKHPLDGYNREQLRKVAKARGITLQRGEARDSIAAKLLADHGPAPKIKATAKVTPPPAPTPPKVPDKPTVSPELAKRIKAVSASLPKTRDE
jgi:hypothetical protein